LHPEWKVIEDPYSPGEDIVLVPATKPDFALIHGYKADKNGNVLVPSYDDRMVAQAADKVIVTVEEIVDYDLGEDPRGGYVIPWPFVNTVVHVPNASHPGGMEPLYDIDETHLNEYITAAKSKETFRAYLEKYIIGHTEAEYQNMISAVTV
tara:strand:+ start:729 stop:1181 length:453 start_codon:yes stop_codon:yes gene_type:complete